MKRAPPPHSVSLNIGPAWLLLSHSGFFGAVIGANSIGYSFLTAGADSSLSNARALGITWTVLAITLGIFLLYALVGTWKENNKLEHPTFGP